MVYQPIYDLATSPSWASRPCCAGTTPPSGLISPDEFIPILEQTGQIREVGRWVLHEACQQMATWHARGDTLDISVNVSGRQLDDDTIVDDVRDALQAQWTEPSKP